MGASAQNVSMCVPAFPHCPHALPYLLQMIVIWLLRPISRTAFGLTAMLASRYLGQLAVAMMALHFSCHVLAVGFSTDIPTGAR